MQRTRSIVAALLAAVALLGGCGQPDHRGLGLETEVPPALAASPGAVTGSRIIHHVTDTGQIDRPEDLTGFSIGALVDGTFYPGTGFADGTFVIPNVPPDVSYYFKYGLPVLGPDYVLTSARTLDLGSYQLGRPDAVPPEASTVLSVGLDGLNPWGATDDLEITSSNAGLVQFNAWAFDLNRIIPRPGDIFLVQRWDYANFFGNLIDASRGDQAVVHQLVTNYIGPPGAGATYAAAAKALATSTLTVANRQTTFFGGTLLDVPQDQIFSLSWVLSTFHAYGSSVHPNAQLQGDELLIDVLPTSSANGFFDAAPDLVEGWVNREAADQTFDFVFGNPFPAFWGAPFAEGLAHYVLSYRLPGTVVPYVANALLFTIDTVANFPNPFPIQISPPQNVQVNGQIATDDLVGVSTMPVITWDPPAVGTATQYSLTFSELFASGGRTAQRRAGRIFTAGTSATVPPGILQLGKRYFLRVTAINRPAVDFQQKPFQTAFPHSGATALTGIIDP